MELDVKNQKENELLHRVEVSGEISFGGATPSNKELRDELSKKLGMPKEFLAVRHIYTKFGEAKATFEAYAYKTKEEFEKVEGKIEVKEEKKEAPAEKPAEAPKEAKAEEKPAEAPKEEKKDAGK